VNSLLILLANCPQRLRGCLESFLNNTAIRSDPPKFPLKRGTSQAIPAVPEDTARVAHAAFPKGNLYLKLRDELGDLYTDEQFTTLYPIRGQAAEPPWRLALIMVLQFLEDLSDRQAANAVRSRIDWKYPSFII
jgi:hypothetical protein